MFLTWFVTSGRNKLNRKVQEIQAGVQTSDKNQLTVSAEDTNLLGKNINTIKNTTNYLTQHKRNWSKSKYTQTPKNNNQHQSHNISKRKAVPMFNTTSQACMGEQRWISRNTFFFHFPPPLFWQSGGWGWGWGGALSFLTSELYGHEQ
jgi:hypothetical protein